MWRRVDKYTPEPTVSGGVIGEGGRRPGRPEVQSVRKQLKRGRQTLWGWMCHEPIPDGREVGSRGYRKDIHQIGGVSIRVYTGTPVETIHGVVLRDIRRRQNVPEV